MVAFTFSKFCISGFLSVLFSMCGCWGFFVCFFGGYWGGGGVGWFWRFFWSLVRVFLWVVFLFLPRLGSELNPLSDNRRRPEASKEYE